MILLECYLRALELLRRSKPKVSTHTGVYIFRLLQREDPAIHIEHTWLPHAHFLFMCQGTPVALPTGEKFIVAERLSARQITDCWLGRCMYVCMYVTFLAPRGRPRAKRFVHKVRP